MRMRTRSASAQGASARGPIAPTLVERERELAGIAATLEAALSESGRALVIEADAGVGKTRLLGEAARLAEERSMACLRARGTELERQFAFGVMRRLLERRVVELDDESRATLLSGVAAPAATLLGGAAFADLSPRDIRFALIHALFWVCSRLAERAPLAIVIDDLHWLDQPSAEALAYLVERIEGLPLAVIVAARPGAADPIAGIDGLVSSPGATTLGLSELTADGTARVLDELLGSHRASFAVAAHEVTAGNPFLLRELALAVASAGIDTNDGGAVRIAELVPDTVARWTVGRLRSLPDSANAVARSLAVLEQAELDVIAAHAELDPRRAAAAAEQLTRAGLVDGSPLRFSHPLVRAVLHEEIPAANRDVAHRRAAETLRERGAPAATIATHLMRSPAAGERWAVDVLRDAAFRQAARGGAAEAAALLGRATAELGEAEDPALLAELGHAEAALGDHRAAIAHLEAAAERAEDPGVRLGARVGLAHTSYALGDFAGAIGVGAAVLAEIPPGEGGRLEAELLMSLLMAARAMPDRIGELSPWLTTPRHGSGGEVTAAELVRLEIRALDSFLRGARKEAAVLVAEVDAALASGAFPDVPTLLAANVGFVLAGLGEHERAAMAYERALERALGRGSPLETAEILEGRVSARWWRGDVTGCLADCETILSLVGGGPEPSKLPMRLCQASMLIERNELADAEATLAYPDELEQRLGGTWGWLALPFGRATVALARHDWRRALEQARLCGERLAIVEAPSPDFLPWRSLAARAADRLGEAEAAAELVGEELELARAIGSPRATGVALATLGTVTASAADLGAAVELLDRAGARLDAARARVELGAVLRRARRPRDARGPLRDGLDLARRIGSSALADRARSELEAAGGRPRRERTTGSDALTPRERQIAELASSGLSNPEIAERLFVTRKTIEAHLRSVFRKLGAASRTELRDALER